MAKSGSVILAIDWSAQDIADGGLADLLAHFIRLYPGVRMEVRVDANCRLREAIKARELDLVVVLQEPGEGGEVIDRIQRLWVAGPDFRWQVYEPLPLVLFEAPCIFRSAALTTLDREGIPWRIALTTPSLAGLRAAVRAGFGDSVRTGRWLEADLHTILTDLPSLPDVELAVHMNPDSENSICERLRESVMDALRDNK